MRREQHYQPETSGSALKLGLFAMNANSGAAMTRVPERWPAHWDEIRQVVELADNAGLDFILPLCRWRGYGGETNPTDESFETFTFAAALASITRQIKLFSTVHIPFVHPTLAARSATTIDHISGGRFAINLVCGWSQNEFEMFGIDEAAHERRYEQGSEWVGVFERMMSEEPFGSHDGQFYSMKDAECRPLPIQRPRPPLMSAAFSPTGRNFAVQYCDTLLTMFSNLDRAADQITDLKNRASAVHRTIEVYTIVHVVCRASDDEAKAYYQHYAETMADNGAVENFARNMAPSAPMVARFLEQNRKSIAGGAGSAPVIGAPETVARMIDEIAVAGFDGVALAFVDYGREVPYFIEHVLPRLTTTPKPGNV
jgi:dimethylsulfone monooxygenase